MRKAFRLLDVKDKKEKKKMNKKWEWYELALQDRNKVDDEDK